MWQVEEMLKGGMGKVGESARSFNEFNDIRREARNQGKTLKQFMGR